ncbi:hypothetical protein [Bacillus sp. SRB3LM]|nr:hypothetical protein [Bacillus sp. SRB3LM]
MTLEHDKVYSPTEVQIDSITLRKYAILLEKTVIIFQKMNVA